MNNNLIPKLHKLEVAPKVYKDLPESPGIYIYFKNDIPIYVGKAINLKRRVASYFRLDLEPKTKRMISEAEKISYIKVASELESLLLEAKLIKLYQPKYNIVLKDDKHALYIQITNDKFPLVKTVRKIDIDNKNARVTYGPFPSSGNVKLVLKMVRRIFPYADHKIGKKPCLYSQIGLCNPCPNEIVQSANYSVLRKKYLANIRHIKTLLDGNINKVQKELEKDMASASLNENFEKASEFRDKIKSLSYITKPQTPTDLYLENPNLYEDIKAKEMRDLKRTLKSHALNVPILRRVECFDVAHLQGASASASMVTFIGGTAEKKYYRHFRINQKKGNDDYGSMLEVVGRRKKHLNDWGRPDLIMVDGGKGQLSVFLRVFEGEGIPIIGLAKKFETLIIPAVNLGTIEIKEFKLPKSPALNFVQRIRDEAHRFAQVYHHRLFKRSLFEKS